MKVLVDIPENALDAFVATGFISKDERDDPQAIAQVLSFFVLQNSNDLSTAQEFWRFKIAQREEKQQAWQAQNAARNYYGNIEKGTAA